MNIYFNYLGDNDSWLGVIHGAIRVSKLTSGIASGTAALSSFLLTAYFCYFAK